MGLAPCAGYIARRYSKETVFTLEFRWCDSSFPAFLPGSLSLQEGHECTTGALVWRDRKVFPLLSRCDPSSPDMLTILSIPTFCGSFSLCVKALAYLKSQFREPGFRADLRFRSPAFAPSESHKMRESRRMLGLTHMKRANLRKPSSRIYKNGTQTLPCGAA